MRLTSTIPLALLAALTLATVAPRAAQPRARSTAPLSIEQLIDIKHPSNPVWSRDSKRIAFTWERAGEAHLYVVPANGSAKPVRFTTLPANLVWSADNSSILFFLGNRLMTMALDGSAPTPRFAAFAGRSPSLSRAGTRMVYLAGGAPDAGGGRGTGGRGGRGRGPAARARCWCSTARRMSTCPTSTRCA